MVKKATRVSRFVAAVEDRPIYVGLDVHKKSYSVALFEPVDGVVETHTCPSGEEALAEQLAILLQAGTNKKRLTQADLKYWFDPKRGDFPNHRVIKCATSEWSQCGLFCRWQPNQWVQSLGSILAQQIFQTVQTTTQLHETAT